MTSRTGDPHGDLGTLLQVLQGLQISEGLTVRQAALSKTDHRHESSKLVSTTDAGQNFLSRESGQWTRHHFCVTLDMGHG